MRQFTEIKGRFSQARDLPRLGKIRLGLKVANAKGVSYPTETEYFVCPQEVKDVYGDTPTELDVLLPSEEKSQIMVSKYSLYGSGAGLKCHGDGVDADRYNEQTKEFEPRKCPCEFLKTDENPKGACTPKTHLMVILPLVSMGGCFQVTTGSAAATKNINSSIDLIRMLTGGRMAWLPMKLRRVPTDMTHEGHKRTHYIVNLTLNATWQQALQIRQNPDRMILPVQYQIAAPIDENPELDKDDLVVDAQTLADASGEEELIQIQHKLKEQQEAKKPEPKPKEKAPEPPPAPAPPVHPVQTNGAPVAIPREDWVMMIMGWDEVPELVDIKKRWKAENKVDNLTLMNAAGQQAFLTFLKAEAVKIGIPVPGL